MTVKRTIQINALGALLSGVTTLSALSATSKSSFENRFETIFVRNAFALKASIAQPVVTPPLPTLPLPKVLIIGLTDLGGLPKALLEITDPGKAVLRPIVLDGDILGVIRILRIDVPAGTVKICIGDVESTLSLKRFESPSTVPVCILPVNPAARIRQPGLEQNSIPWPLRR
jgi:hypothetical protein